MRPRTRSGEEARPSSATARQRGALARRDALAKLGAVAVLSLALLLSADPVTSGLILGVELVGLAAIGQRPGALLLRIWPLLVAALLSGWGTAVLSDAGGHLWVSAGPLQLTAGSIAAGAAIALRGLALALPGSLSLVPLVVVTQTVVELVGMVVLIRLIPRLLPEPAPASGPA